MTRKGIFEPILIVMVIPLLVFAFYMSALRGEGQTKYVGQLQMELVGIYNEGEKFYFYSELAFRHVSSKVMEQLAENGGFFAESECGRLDSYNKWLKGKKLCFPNKDEFRISFEKAFRESLNEYINLFGDTDKTLDNSFTTRLDDEKLVVDGAIRLESKKTKLKYSLPYHFEYNLWVLKELETLRISVSDTMKCLENKDLKSDEDINNCLRYINFKYEKEGRILKTDIAKFDSVLNKDLVIKFALDFSEGEDNLFI